MISAPPCLGLSWNTVELLKQAGIQLSHSQHSRGGHSAFLPNLSVQELTEQVKMWKKSELIIWASKWANEWVTNEEGLQLSWVNEWSCRALSKSLGVIKKKILCCFHRLHTLRHNFKRHSSLPCAWRTSAETFLLLVPRGTTSFHANSALHSDSGRLWCCSILLRASSYTAKFQASSRPLQGKPSYCTHSQRSLKVLNRFPKQWASYCSRLECKSDSDSECVPLNKTLWAPQQPLLEKCFTRFTLIKIRWECWRRWGVTLVSQTKFCRLSLTPSRQSVPKGAATKLK